MGQAGISSAFFSSPHKNQDVPGQLGLREPRCPAEILAGWKIPSSQAGPSEWLHSSHARGQTGASL